VRLAGKTALITGASRNIGWEIALTFAREGADLVLSAFRSKKELEAVAAQCRELGVKTHTALADIADSAQWAQMAQERIDALGKIDVLVSNAAIRPHHPLLTVSDEDWHRILASTCTPAFTSAKPSCPP
jgi:3-oxoacyl-[acyl-carrier protein] reductase